MYSRINTSYDLRSAVSNLIGHSSLSFGFSAAFQWREASKSWLLPKTQNLLLRHLLHSLLLRCSHHNNNNRINSSRIAILMNNKTWRLMFVSLSLFSDFRNPSLFFFQFSDDAQCLLLRQNIDQYLFFFFNSFLS